MIVDIVTPKDLVDLQNNSVDLIGKEGELFFIQINFICQVL